MSDEQKKLYFQQEDKINFQQLIKKQQLKIENRHGIESVSIKEPGVDSLDSEPSGNFDCGKFPFFIANSKSRQNFAPQEEKGKEGVFQENERSAKMKISLDHFLLDLEDEDNLSKNITNRFEIFEDSYKAIKENSRKVLNLQKMQSLRINQVSKNAIQERETKNSDEKYRKHFQAKNSEILEEFEKTKKELNLIILGQSTLINQYEKYIESLQEKNDNLLKSQNVITQKQYEFIEEKNRLDKELQKKNFNSSIVEKNYKSKIIELSYEKRNLLEKIIKLQEQIENLTKEKYEIILLNERLEALKQEKQNFITESKNIQSTIASLNSKFESTKEELMNYKNKERSEKSVIEKLMLENDNLKKYFMEEKNKLSKENLELKNRIQEYEEALLKNSQKKQNLLLSQLSVKNSEKNYFEMAKRISTTPKRQKTGKNKLRNSIKLDQFKLGTEKTDLIQSMETSLIQGGLNEYLNKDIHISIKKTTSSKNLENPLNYKFSYSSKNNTDSLAKKIDFKESNKFNNTNNDSNDRLNSNKIKQHNLEKLNKIYYQKSFSQPQNKLANTKTNFGFSSKNTIDVKINQYLLDEEEKPKSTQRFILNDNYNPNRKSYSCNKEVLTSNKNLSDNNLYCFLTKNNKNNQIEDSNQILSQENNHSDSKNLNASPYDNNKNMKNQKFCKNEKGSHRQLGHINDTYIKHNSDKNEIRITRKNFQLNEDYFNHAHYRKNEKLHENDFPVLQNNRNQLDHKNLVECRNHFEVNTQTDTKNHFELNTRKDTRNLFEINTQMDSRNHFELNTQRERRNHFEVNTQMDTKNHFNRNNLKQRPKTQFYPNNLNQNLIIDSNGININRHSNSVKKSELKKDIKVAYDSNIKTLSPYPVVNQRIEIQKENQNYLNQNQRSAEINQNPFPRKSNSPYNIPIYYQNEKPIECQNHLNPPFPNSNLINKTYLQVHYTKNENPYINENLGNNYPIRRIIRNSSQRSVSEPHYYYQGQIR